MLTALFTGLIIGVTMVLWSVTISALVFSGALQPYVAQGTGFFLFGSMALALIMALMSSYPGTIAASDEAAAIITSVMAASIVAATPKAMGIDAAFATVMVVIVVSTLLSGVVFLTLGRLRLGNLVRFIPHPVVGGVVVVMGWLILVGAFGLMVDQELSIESLSLLAQTDALSRWMPGVAFAISLVILTKRSSHFLIFPGAFVIATGLFYLAAFSLGMSVTDLEAEGWLLGPFTDNKPMSLPDWSAVGRLDWSLVIDQASDIASLILLCLLGLLLSAKGIELSIRQDMDLNHELYSAGIANIAAALGGGITGSHSIEDTVLARQLGAPYRLVGIVTAIVCGIALVFGISTLSYLPKPLLGGFILFFGLILMIEWVYEGWFKLPKPDYAIILLCLVVCITVGYLEGIAVGLLAGVVIFVVSCSRIEVVKHALSGSGYHSNVERDSESQEYLNAQGDRIYVMKLQGYVFFGTAHKILAHTKKRLANKHHLPLDFLILDFRSVVDIDTSTVDSFEKMRHLAEHENFQILFTQVSPGILSHLKKCGLTIEPNSRLQVFADTDRGLEWCEEKLLSASFLSFDSGKLRVDERLRRYFPEQGMAATLMTYLERESFPRGAYLIRQGQDSTDLFFLESGRVSIQFEMKGKEPVRMRSAGAGTVVGEMALYLGKPRSASIVADRPCVTYRLTVDAMHKMKKEHSDLAASFHQFIVCLLAKRLTSNNKLIEALTD